MGNFSVKKVLAPLALVLVFSLSLLTTSLFANLVAANPSPPPTVVEVPPRSTTIPPQISLISPQNNSLYNKTFLILNFNALPPSGPDVYLDERFPYASFIYYKIDSEQQDNDVSYSLASDKLLNDHVTIYDKASKLPIFTNFSSEVWGSCYPKISNLTVAGLSEGNHNVTIFVWYQGKYVNTVSDADIETFSIRASCTVNFSIDTMAPNISLPSVDNKTFTTSNVTLSCITNEPISNASYVLDGEMNVAFTGNITLANLSIGLHNVTVYASDYAGNAGSSETAFFMVQMPPPEPFPTITVAAASMTSAVVASAGVIFYLRKQSQK